MLSSSEIADALLRAVWSQADRLGVKPLVVLLGGSYNEGLSTSTSDYDLILVHDADQAPGGAKFATAWIADRKLEILLYTMENYLRLATSCERRSEDGNLFYYLDARRRVLCSKAILGSAIHEQTLAAADTETFARDVLSYHVSLGQKSLADLRGALRDGATSSDVLAIRLRSHLERTVDNLLIVQGDYYFRPKWRCARIARTFHSDARLSPLADGVCAGLSGRNLRGCPDERSWYFETSRQCLLLEFFTWFRGEWDVLTAEELSCLGDERWPFFSIGKNRDETYRILTADAAFAVAPEIAHALCLQVFGLPEERREVLAAQLYAHHAAQRIDSHTPSVQRQVVATLIEKIGARDQAPSRR